MIARFGETSVFGETGLSLLEPGSPSPNLRLSEGSSTGAPNRFFLLPPGRRFGPDERVAHRRELTPGVPQSLMKTAAAIVLACSFVSCTASNAGYERAAATADGTQAHRENLVDLRGQLGLTLDALRTLGESPDVLPRSNRETFETFARELRNLEHDAENARKSYGRMDARAGQFFGSWNEDTAAIADADLRKRAEDRRAALQASYVELAREQRDTDVAVAGFMRRLDDLCIYLEHDLTAAGIASAAQPIADALAEGARIQQSLSDLAHRADAAQAGLEPLKAQAPSQNARNEVR